MGVHTGERFWKGSRDRDSTNLQTHLSLLPLTGHPPPFSYQAHFLCRAKRFLAPSSRDGLLLFPGPDSLAPSHNTPLQGAVLGERLSPEDLFRTRGPSQGPHWPQESPGLQNPKLETIPSPPAQCSQGTWRI